jgi:DNA-binding MarR family transcriptional regulator
MSNYSPEELVALARKFGMERDRYVTLLARESNIGRTEFVALDYLQEAGDLKPSELAERLLLTSGAMTALVDRLEEAGLVIRVANPMDRRSWLLRLTKEAGGTGATQLGPYLRDLHTASRRFSASERAAIGRFLEAAADVVVKHSGARRDNHRASTIKRSRS